MAKLRFDKATKNNKKFLVGWGMEFQLKQDSYFDRIIDIIAALRWRWFKSPEVAIESII